MMCTLGQAPTSKDALAPEQQLHMRPASFHAAELILACVRLQKGARDKAAKAPPSFLGRSWTLAFAISVFIAVIVFVFGFGFGAWASVLSLKQNGNTFGAFAACYQVRSACPECRF